MGIHPHLWKSEICKSVRFALTFFAALCFTCSACPRPLLCVFFPSVGCFPVGFSVSLPTKSRLSRRHRLRRRRPIPVWGIKERKGAGTEIRSGKWRFTDDTFLTICRNIKILRGQGAQSIWPKGFDENRNPFWMSWPQKGRMVGGFWVKTPGEWNCIVVKYMSYWAV